MAVASEVEGVGAARFGAILIDFLLCSRWQPLMWVAGGGAGAVMAADPVQQRGSRARVAREGYAGALRVAVGACAARYAPADAYLG